MGGLFADQSISFQLMQQKMTQFVEILRQDPAVESVSGSTGGGQTNTCFIFATLRPLSEGTYLGRTGDGALARTAQQGFGRWILVIRPGQKYR